VFFFSEVRIVTLRNPMLGAVLATALIAASTHAAPFLDPLDAPAQLSPLASKSLVQAVTRAGTRVVAVGARGHVLVSADDGQTWRQSPVPVSSDLTSVFFVDERNGWAVGHDGVILATTDGGATWALQLDGARANRAIVDDLARKPGAAALLAEANRNVAQGADKPFLDVWFADEKVGYAVGAYNYIFRTADGGKSWKPWFDRTDNPKYLNLYAIRPAAGGLFIVGEAGLVLRLDATAQRFRTVDIGYQGTLLGVAGNENVVLAFGLRGSAFRSDDSGRTWMKVDARLASTIVGGASLPDGGFALADASGHVSVSRDAARTFSPVALPVAMMLTGIADGGPGRVALAGGRGVVLAPIAAH
jgi:photosystem II stability/assembly factor-like uncharacterized protein